jgi:UDP-2,4-diacetamido-2,4,6-trideoxy-beta-L-altropyranose hydrolase
MNPLRIAFRTDANQQIGTGHFMRCLTLADEMRQSPADICFVSRALPLHLQQMLSEHGVQYIALPENELTQETDELPHAAWLTTSQAKDAEQTMAALGAGTWDWLVVDHYALDHRFEKHLRAVCQHVMVIDDLADRVHDCDVLLDQNFYQDQALRYLDKVPAHCRLLLGPNFALLRPEFKAMRDKVQVRAGKVNNILVFFGGVDADNLTGQVLDVLIKLNLGIQVNVVIGQQHPQKEMIRQLCEQHSYNCHVQTNQMASLMAEADLAIGAGGTAVWERCSVGSPSLCLITAENQRQQLQELQSAGLVNAPTNKENAITFLSSYLKDLSTSFKSRKVQSQRMMALVDGRGAGKVVNKLKAQVVQMRVADAKDAQAIFEWRNHPSVRNHSANTQEINWEKHYEWFKQRLSDNSGSILIGEVNRQALGVVRFDIFNHEAMVSIYLVPDSGLKGWGSCLLEQAESWLRQHHPEVVKLHAQVLPNNEPSKKLFDKLNYNLTASMPKLEFVKDLEACT